MNPRSEKALKEHLFRVEALGGKDLGDPWEGASQPRRTVCAQGHECSPRPSSVKQGRGLCSVCAGNSTEAAFKDHVARVEALGGKDLGDPWEGMWKRRRTLCAKGHECSPVPQHVQQGWGLCRTCARRR